LGNGQTNDLSSRHGCPNFHAALYVLFHVIQGMKTPDLLVLPFSSGMTPRFYLVATPASSISHHVMVMLWDSYDGLGGYSFMKYSTNRKTCLKPSFSYALRAGMWESSRPVSTFAYSMPRSRNLLKASRCIASPSPLP